MRPRYSSFRGTRNRAQARPLPRGIAVRFDVSFYFGLRLPHSPEADERERAGELTAGERIEWPWPERAHESCSNRTSIKQGGKR